MQIIGGKGVLWDEFNKCLSNLHCLLNGGACIKTEDEIETLITQLCALRIHWVSLSAALEDSLSSSILLIMDQPDLLDEYVLLTLIRTGLEPTMDTLHEYNTLLKTANANDRAFIKGQLIPWLVKRFDLNEANLSADIPITQRVYKKVLSSCLDCPLFMVDTRQCGRRLSPTEGRVIREPYFIPDDCTLAHAEE
jgi:hypothetical protein